jgi:hypothetical protein
MSKYFIIFFFLPFFSWAQQSEGVEMKQYFWNTNIRNIAEMDKDSILIQTNFPLEIKWGARREKWTKEQFRLKLSTVFDASVIDQFKNDSYESIDAWTYEDESTPTYMLVVYPENEEFNVIVLSFKQFNEDWKLYQMDFHYE